MRNRGVLTLVLTLVLIACSGGGNAVEEGGGGAEETAAGTATTGAGGEGDSTFVFLLPDLPTGLDTITDGGSTAYVGNERLSTLVTWDHAGSAEGGCTEILDVADVRGDLAESWERSPDGKLLTFTLREGVSSPFGNELTAEDVRWSFERFLAEAPPANFFYTNVSLLDLENEPFRVIDDRTFALALREPGSMDVALNVFFRLMVHDSTEASKHATDADPLATEWLSRNSANYGPWHFTEEDYTEGQELIMHRNPNYSGEVGNVDTVIFRAIPESSTRAQLVQAGDADYAAFLAYSDNRLLSDGNSVTVLPCVGPERDILLLNQADERFADVRVRQAISHAIDRETISDTIYQGFAEAATSGLHSQYDFEQPGQQYEYDPERARELLAEADLADGFEMELVASPARPGAYAPEVAALIAAQLAEVGITVQQRVITSGTEFATAFNEGAYQAMVYNESIALPDPAYALGLLAVCEGYQNSFNHCDPEYDRLQAELQATDPGPERSAIMTEAAGHIVENPGIIYLADVGLPRVFGANVDVDGYLHSPYSTTVNVYAINKTE